ncbi:MAG: hypothetical protein K9W46_04105 [Candidatus Heimdallarchaeum endolithica]|uniref:Polysaccharide biosynthesis protein C-terminal domain-containing protein n=1 Tax=Candidatus Heimdallarchaeum endolithica TaxID=2876572 RepID=A0A9Y1FP22_9ARCH|nr:MAG: hypothetical protein K9W46_04105 [Candidatus Heimdallarchaeum endolithica]
MLEIKNLKENQIFKDSFFLLLRLIISAITNFIFWLIGNRFYSLESIGIAGFIISIGLFSSTLSIFGVDMSLIHYIRKGLFKSDYIISNLIKKAFSIVLLLSVVMSVLSSFYYIVFIYSGEKHRNIYIISIVLITFSIVLHILQESIYLGFKRSNYIFIRELILMILKILFIYFLKFLVYGILLTLILSYLISFFLMIIFDIKKILKLLNSIEKSESHNINICEFFKYSFVNYLSILIARMPGFIYTILIIKYIGMAENGVFTTIWSLSNLVFLSVGSISNAIYSKLSERDSLNKTNIYKIIVILEIAFIIGISILLPLSKHILVLYSTEVEEKGLRPFRILLLSALPYLINRISGSIYRSFNYRKLLLVNESLISFVSIMCSWTMLQILNNLEIISLSWFLAHIITMMMNISFLYKKLKKPEYIIKNNLE